MDFWLWLLIMGITKSFPLTRQRRTFWYILLCWWEELLWAFYKDKPYWQTQKATVDDQCISAGCKSWMKTRMERLASVVNTCSVYHPVLFYLVPDSLLLYFNTLKYEVLYMDCLERGYGCYSLFSSVLITSVCFPVGQTKSTLWTGQDSSGTRSKNT